MLKREPLLTELFLSTALAEAGYTARANRDNLYGERLGVNGQPWDGIFIDWVAREVGLPLVPHMHPTVALADYISNGRLHGKPKRGDIVFFQMSTVSDFGSPHVGIVTDTSRYATDGVFETIEAMTDSGQPKGGIDLNGVFKRVRHKLDVIGFGRPDFVKKNPVARLSRVPDNATDSLPRISLAQVKPNTKHKHIATLQIALGYATGVSGLPRAHFDMKTRSAYASFQRKLGYPFSRATGHPDSRSMRALAEQTRMFVFVE